MEQLQTTVTLAGIQQAEENPLHLAAHISASVDHPFPLDILVIRPADLVVALQEKDYLLNRTSIHWCKVEGAAVPGIPV